MAREEGGDEVEVIVPLAGKRRASRKGKKTGVVVGIAAVVLVGVAGKLLSRFVRLNQKASSADVLSKTLVSGEAAENLRKPPHDLASAALGSAFQKMNGEGSADVNGRVLHSDPVEDSDAAQLNEVRGFVMTGTLQEKAGVPTVRSEFKILGAEDVQDPNGHPQALRHETTDIPRGNSENEDGSGHQEAIQNGTHVFVTEQTVGRAEDGQQLYVYEDADALPSLEFVTSVSYDAENSLEVKCTATSLKPLVQIEESRSSSLLETESCGSQGEKSQIDELSVAEGSPESSVDYTSFSHQTSPHPLGDRTPPRSPSKLDCERVADRTAEVYDPDLVQNRLLHSNMVSATTCLGDGPALQETTIFWPPTPTRHSESGTDHLQPVSSPRTPTRVSNKATDTNHLLPVSSHHADLVAEMDPSSEGPGSPGELSEDLRRAKENIVEAIQEVRDMTTSGKDLAQTLEERVTELTIDKEAPIFEGKPEVELTRSKVDTATENGTVQSAKASAPADAAPTLEMHKPSGEFWAYVGRGVPCTMLFGFFLLLLSLFLLAQ